MALQGSGSLIVRPISAKLERDLEALTTMDPYVIVKIGNQEIKTNYCVDGGKAPHWDEQLNFVVSGEDMAYIGVWDKRSLRSDQEIGSVHFPLYKLYENKRYEDWIEILCNGQRAGVLRLHMEFRPTLSSGQAGMTGMASGQQMGTGYQGGEFAGMQSGQQFLPGQQGYTGQTGLSGSGFSGQQLSGQQYSSGMAGESRLVGSSDISGASGISSGLLPGQPGYTEFTQTKSAGGTTEVISGVSEPGYTEVGYVKVQELGERGLEQSGGLLGEKRELLGEKRAERREGFESSTGDIR